MKEKQDDEGLEPIPTEDRLIGIPDDEGVTVIATETIIGIDLRTISGGRRGSVGGDEKRGSVGGDEKHG